MFAPIFIYALIGRLNVLVTFRCEATAAHSAEGCARLLPLPRWELKP